MIGTHTALVYEDRDEPTGTPVDISCLIDSINVRYGRTDTAGQPQPASATVDITVGPGAPLPDIVEIGAWLIVDTALGGNSYRRFTGRVTDLSLGWDDAGEETPDAGIGQIVAVSPLADYARRVIGDVPFPQELDGVRVARVFELAGLTLDPLYSDPGTVEVIPRDVDKRAALEVASDTATSGGGLIWETRSGDIRYADAEHRRGAAVALELDACDILVTPTWVRNISGLVNDISMTYGVAEEGGSERPSYQATSPASMAKFGRYEYSVTVELATAEDAAASANLILAQNAGPVWMLAALPVDIGGMTLADSQGILGLELHALLRVTGIPSTGATPTIVLAWVEGWTETLAWGIHDIELTVSDYCRTSPPPRWDDIDTAELWNTISTAITWDSVVCLGPILNQGRWDDVAANTRWDLVPASVIWDTATV